jgi:ATP-dependent protease ClpP protease subunit
MAIAHGVPLRHINEATTMAISRAIHSARTHRKQLEILINSGGGDVEEGLRIIEMLKRSPVQVNATVDGTAGSTAAVIFQCATVRRMTASSTLLYHYANGRVGFQAFYDKKMLDRFRDKVLACQNALIEPIKQRTGMSDKEVHALLREAKTLGANEALARGLIDVIV